MRTGFRLTPRAFQDLNAIADYMIENWGTDQLEDYLQSLNDRFEWLSQNALAGRERNDVQPGYRSFPEGSHLIFYIIEDGHIDIIGIPHKFMDIGPIVF